VGFSLGSRGVPSSGRAILSQSSRVAMGTSLPSCNVRDILPWQACHSALPRDPPVCMQHTVRQAGKDAGCGPDGSNGQGREGGGRGRERRAQPNRGRDGQRTHRRSLPHDGLRYHHIHGVDRPGRDPEGRTVALFGAPAGHPVPEVRGRARCRQEPPVQVCMRRVERGEHAGRQYHGGEPTLSGGYSLQGHGDAGGKGGSRHQTPEDMSSRETGGSSRCPKTPSIEPHVRTYRCEYDHRNEISLSPVAGRKGGRPGKNGRCRRPRTRSAP
jgi:hypothetical protein